MLYRVFLLFGFGLSSWWLHAAASDAFTPFAFGAMWAICGIQLLHHFRRAIADERDNEEDVRPFGSKVHRWKHLREIFRRR